MLFGKAGFIRLRGMHLVTQISVIRPITETVTVFAAGIAGTVFIHTGQVSLNQRTQKKNWIGRSTGAEVDFKTTEGDILTVFTTRPDTLFGATYMVISPEHPMVEAWSDKLKNIDAVRAYREEAARKSDFERTELNKDKTGVQLDGVANRKSVV